MKKLRDYLNTNNVGFSSVRNQIIILRDNMNFEVFNYLESNNLQFTELDTLFVIQL